jgi:hypothetical protein
MWVMIIYGALREGLMIIRGRHHKHYSIITITLHYVLALLYNVFLSVENSYRF